MREREDISQYNTALDSQRYVNLMVQQGSAGFEDRLAQENMFTKVQLRSDLGERLHVTKSDWTYEIRGGELFDPVSNRPMEDVVRGGLWRNAIDRERDEAEFSTFVGVIQGYLADDNTPDGTTLLTISPPGDPGSDEIKNLFRVFVREGKYVLSYSYFSDLDNRQYWKKIENIDPTQAEQIPDNPSDVDLKLHPIIIPNYLEYWANPDKLAEFILDGRKIGMPVEQFEQTWIDVTPLATSVINTLAENPEAIMDIEERYQAFLGGAHISIKYRTDNIVPENSIFRIDEEKRIVFSDSRWQLQMLAGESDKIGGGACGAGGCSTGSFEGIDGKGTQFPKCPACGEANTRPLFSYVFNCQKCGSDKIMPPELRKSLEGFQPGQQLAQ